MPPYSPDYNLIELVWHSAKEYIAHRLFQSVEQLKNLLDRLLNQGELIIKWHRRVKKKVMLLQQVKCGAAYNFDLLISMITLLTDIFVQVRCSPHTLLCISSFRWPSSM